MTFNNTAQDHLGFLKQKLSSKLENLDKTLVRAEYKMAIYTRYALPALRYHLTVHTVHKCHLEELDMLAQRFLKKWLGIPSRGCTSAGIFSPLLFGVKPVSQVYLEGHVSAFISSKMMADEDTKEALRCAEERESEWVRKSSTITQCKDILEEMTSGEECTIPTPENCANFAVTVRVEKPKVMKIGKQKVAAIYKRQSVAEKLGMQGEVLALLDQEGKILPGKPVFTGSQGESWRGQ